MPDASHPREPGSASWSRAFAALPSEAPPAGSWEQVAARLDARALAVAAPVADAGMAARTKASRRRRVSGWLGLATAAALALAVAWPDRGPAEHPLPAAAAVAPAHPRAARPAIALTRPAHALSAGAKPLALPAAVEARRKPRFAASAGPVHAVPSRATHAGRGHAGATPLDDLYAESARLEALLALARDDRVSSAGAALLSAEFDAQVAGIDAQLAASGLGDAQREQLWQARVDALRQAAGFETTQRVLAARGDGAALLVSVD